MPKQANYRQVPIRECGEPLCPLPPEIERADPHPYACLGAPYDDASPFCLRRGVLERLLAAQQHLQRTAPQLHFQVFDAYRPIAVQQFMVEWTFREQLALLGLEAEHLDARQRAAVYTQVYRFWAVPSLDPATPPPHSTGAAVDLTLADQSGLSLDLGSGIDEISERSSPEYFAAVRDGPARIFQERRSLLQRAMAEAGFNQHRGEWWHFSFGDQMWAFDQGHPEAIYGRV